jgi:hypothetical protein
MGQKSELWKMMQEPLPALAEQKRLPYRPSKAEAKRIYKLINESIFSNMLATPDIELMGNCPKYWGMCYGEYSPIKYRKTRCRIRLMDKFYCRQWFIVTLAHELIHQFQWDIVGPTREEQGKERMLSHGPTFFQFRDKFAKHGMPLKVSLRSKKWFTHQDLFKC